MKPPMIRLIAGLPGTFLLLFSICVPARAQQFISAKAATILCIEGKVFLDGSPVHIRDGSYLSMENGHVLSTEEGRAEILLTPFVYLRLDEFSALRIRDNRLVEVQLDLNRGSALIEIQKRLETDPIRVNISDSSVEIQQEGLYRIDSAPGGIRVYGGSARTVHKGKIIRIKEGRMLLPDGKSAPRKFDTKAADALHRWAARRSLDLFTAGLVISKPRNSNELAWRPRPGGLYHPDYRLTLPCDEDWNRYWMGVWESIARQNEKRMRDRRASPQSIVIPEQNLIIQGSDTNR